MLISLFASFSIAWNLFRMEAPVLHKLAELAGLAAWPIIVKNMSQTCRLWRAPCRARGHGPPLSERSGESIISLTHFTLAIKYAHTWTHAHTGTKGHTYHTQTHADTDTLVDNTRLTVVQLNGPTLYGSISSQSFSQSLEKSIQGLGLDASSNGWLQLFAPKLSKVCERV